MRKMLINLGAVVVLGALFHLGIVVAMPANAMRFAVKKIEASARRRAVLEGKDPDKVRTVNQLLHGPRRTARTREVVAPNPDMLFSVILYDVSRKALFIEVPVPGSYFSISCYGDNTDNFFVTNDRQARSGVIRLVLVGAHGEAPRLPGALVVRAASDRGVILFRYLIKNEAHYREIEKVRGKAKVRTL